MEKLSTLLGVLGLAESQVYAAYCIGSRVYGTASPNSDEDFVAVLATPGQKQDLAFGPKVNAVIHGIHTFQEALSGQSVFALECYFAPKEYILKPPKPPFSYRLDKKKLALSALNRSSSDWDKGIKRFLDEPHPSKKKLFHALRVPTFALQVLKTGTLGDFSAANDFWMELATGPDTDPHYYQRLLGPVRERLYTELFNFCGTIA